MKIRIGFLAVMLALSLLLTRSLFSLGLLLAALSHELGHIMMAKACKIRLKECTVGIYGAGLMPEYSLYSYSKEIFLCLAGPLCNFLFGSAGLVIGLRYPSEFLEYFSISSLILGCMNLLPIRDFDGGRILLAVFSVFFSPEAAQKIQSILSFLFVFLLWSLSIYLLLCHAASLSLFIFSLSLFVRIFIPEA
ncbi:MAG: M50 family metallopeptidase [Clostridia bacterium]|nr:M50 family metallopeptidase [Clostridia bacterium]